MSINVVEVNEGILCIQVAYRTGPKIWSEKTHPNAEASETQRTETNLFPNENHRMANSLQ